MIHLQTPHELWNLLYDQDHILRLRLHNSILVPCKHAGRSLASRHDPSDDEASRQLHRLFANEAGYSWALLAGRRWCERTGEGQQRRFTRAVPRRDHMAIGDKVSGNQLR
jgi:hypothetical protein